MNIIIRDNVMKKVILALMAALMVLPFSVAAKKKKTCRHQCDFLQHPRGDSQRRDQFLGIPLSGFRYDDHGSEA